MFKKTISLCLALILALSLTACGHEHQWAEANCTTPKTCSGCNETEGEALGYTWADATCSAPKTCTVCGAAEGEALAHAWADAACAVPKTCSVCGETEGEALGHTWVDANYQQPKTCSVCNATEGEPLITYFEESGLDASLLDMSGTYELPLACYQDESKTTIAQVTVDGYQTMASDETHEALDGYEWKVLTFKLHFYDENAMKYGLKGWHYLWANRYEEAIKDSGEDSDNEGLFTTGLRQSFVWNGTEYEDGVLRIEESVTDWQKDEHDAYYLDIFVTISIRVPVGHDEFIFGLEHTGWEWPESAYLHECITDAALLFRFI